VGNRFYEQTEEAGASEVTMNFRLHLGSMSLRQPTAKMAGEAQTLRGGVK